MLIGIFAEGRGDLAVITNVLKGAIKIDRSDLRYELPEFEKDQTDLSVMPMEQHSSWTVVKEVCVGKEKIDKFFNSPIDQPQFIIIHLDTAERYEIGFDIAEPKKSDISNMKDYSVLLRENVIGKIDEWLENRYRDQVAYAVPIEETDAWVLTIYDDANADTAIHNNPKERLNRILNRSLSSKEKNILKSKAFEKYDFLTVAFRKSKTLLDCSSRNESLRLFCDSLQPLKTEEPITE